MSAVWGRSSVPNITNQEINPANNLLMQLRHTTEHSNADCVQYVTEQVCKCVMVLMLSPEAWSGRNYCKKITFFFFKCMTLHTKRCILITKEGTRLWKQILSKPFYSSNLEISNCLSAQTSLYVKKGWLQWNKQKWLLLLPLNNNCFQQ